MTAPRSTGSCARPGRPPPSTTRTSARSTRSGSTRASPSSSWSCWRARRSRTSSRAARSGWSGCSTWPPRSRTGSRPPTRRGSCTATSSRPTSSSPGRARRRSSTSAWRSSSPCSTPAGQSEVATAVPRGELTSAGSTLGTLYYMSPEQARGEALDAPERSLLLRRGPPRARHRRARPSTASTAAVVFQAIFNETPRPRARHNPTLPPELDRIIGKALEKDPELRYQTAAELRSDLRRLRRDLDSGKSARGCRLRARGGLPGGGEVRRRPLLREPERRQGRRVLPRRHDGRHHHRAHEDRGPQGLPASRGHGLPGPAGDRPRGRSRAQRRLRRERQPEARGQSASGQRPAHPHEDGPRRLGRALRPADGGRLRGPGRDRPQHRRGAADQAVAPRGEGDRQQAHREPAGLRRLPAGAQLRPARDAHRPRVRAPDVRARDRARPRLRGGLRGPRQRVRPLLRVARARRPLGGEGSRRLGESARALAEPARGPLGSRAHLLRAEGLRQDGPAGRAGGGAQAGLRRRLLHARPRLLRERPPRAGGRASPTAPSRRTATTTTSTSPS